MLPRPLHPEEAEQLRADLGALGFDAVRFAAAPSAQAAGTRGSVDAPQDFAAWLAAGNHADMGWLERGLEKRRDPAAVLPGLRSVIALGVNYRPADPASAAQSRWAKYAVYTDYHDTIKVALHRAGRILESRFGMTRDDYRVYVDTGPILERGWAARAGMGWQGKNAMMISREHGNWLFLAAILLRLDVPPDPPLRPARDGTGLNAIGDYCGSCTRCLTACPTAAFPRPGWVDARRCISYHTIENRGIIPRELRAAFGARVFGCDTCLDVCPWNRFAQAARSALLESREDIARLSLIDLLEMHDEDFRRIFRRTSIKRTGLDGLLRNACIAAGNWNHSADWHFGPGADRERVAAAVERLCAHTSEIVRAHAVWALFALLGAAEASARTAIARANECSDLVRDEYRAAGSVD